MISEQTVNKFLNRELDDFGWMKQLSSIQINSTLNELVPQHLTENLWIQQKVGLLIMQHHSRFVFHYGMGGGKALPYNEKVLTPYGWKEIGQIKVGEYIIGVNGKPTRVMGVYPQGKKNISEVVFSDKSKVRCCEDHLWAVRTPRDKHRGTPYKIIPTKDLGNLRDKFWRKWFIPIVEPVEFSETYLPLHPYILGAWIGDGSRNSTAIESEDEEIIYKILSNLPSDFRAVKGKSSNKSNPYNFAQGGKKSKNDFREALRELNLFGKYSWERFVPINYMFSTINNRIELLQGLLDTDGYVSKDGKIYFDTSSKQLGYDVVHLVRSLGGTATISDFIKNEHKGFYSIYIVLPTKIEPCSLTRKKIRFEGSHRRKNSPTRSIVAVNPKGEAECICIKVEAEDGLFVTTDFVVTHNTNLMLTMLRHRKLKGEKPRAIVFVPSISAIDTWPQEVNKFAPELKCCPLFGSAEENLIALQSDEFDLFVVCYQTAVAMLHKKIMVKVKGKPDKPKWALDDVLVKAAFNDFDTLICDEFHRVSNHNSLTFQLCNYISEKAEYVYGLTGTPFGSDLQNLWAEFYVIDFGETLGPNISFFRTIFFTRKDGFFGGVKFEIKKKLIKPLQRMIKNKSIHYSVKEFADMPEKVYIQKRIRLPEGISERVEQAKKQLYTAQKNKDLVEAGNAFMKLRQLSSGFITFKNEDERVKVKFDSNPKLDALCELIEAMPPECKMVVFHDYVFTNEIISGRLKELKIGHARIWGGQKDQLGQLKKFREDARCKVLIINSKSGSSALNLQNANYLVFFEGCPVIDRTQAEARCYRPGQKNKVFIYDLFVRGTVDESHYNSVKNGSDFLADFMAGKVEA